MKIELQLWKKYHKMSEFDSNNFKVYFFPSIISEKILQKLIKDSTCSYFKNVFFIIFALFSEKVLNIKIPMTLFDQAVKIDCSFIHFL